MRLAKGPYTILSKSFADPDYIWVVYFHCLDLFPLLLRPHPILPTEELVIEHKVKWCNGETIDLNEMIVVKAVRHLEILLRGKQDIDLDLMPCARDAHIQLLPKVSSVSGGFQIEYIRKPCAYQTLECLGINTGP